MRLRYLNTILDSHAQPALIKSKDDARLGLEELVEQKFAPYFGKTVEEISDMLDFHRRGKTDKGFSKALVMRMLGTTNRTLPEFEKAGIETKIITLNRSGTPKEYMPFPAFDYMKIGDEEWADSSFFAKLEKRFLFVIFQTGTDKMVRFQKAAFWNMPYQDRKEAYRVWATTKRQVTGGNAQNLPKISESEVAHVRPHGANNSTTLFPTPQGDMLPRMGFWLNKTYIAKQLQDV